MVIVPEPVTSPVSVIVGSAVSVVAILAVSPALVNVALPVTFPVSSTVTALDNPPAVPVVF